MIVNIKGKKYKKTKVFSAFSALAILIMLLSISGTLLAKVTGPCANCHTMHNSQNGSPVASGGPYDILLVNTCLGCHSSSTTSTYYTLGGCNVPVVLYTGGEPANYLAGGNFYWVKAGLGGDDTKGHNVFLGEPDDNLNLAPGSSAGCGGPGPGNTSCHTDLYTAYTNPIFNNFPRQGCTKCHMIGTGSAPKGYHHLDDSGPLIDSSAEGWYRFLDGHMSGAGQGVTGIEDSHWEATPSSTDHNEYLGFSADKTSPGGFSAIGNTMTGFCTGCHGNFHQEKNTVSGPWIRHPSDTVIPTYGEYASAFGASGGTGTYDPNVPVARPDLSTGSWPSSNVTLGTDMVMCLSCHRSHGSPYPDMLRWDYSTMLAGGGGSSGGCFSCHTQKDD